MNPASLKKPWILVGTAGLAALLLYAIWPQFAMAFTYGSRDNLDWRGDAYWHRQFLRQFADTGTAGAAFRQHNIDPLLGWLPKPGLTSSTALESTDEHGYRSDEPYQFREDAIRVLALGDSFTFGQGVPDGQDWPAQLEDLDPRMQVFNLGVCGHGVDQMYLRLRESIAVLKPHIVVLAAVSDDFNRTLLSFREYAKPRFRLSPEGAVELTNLPIPSMEEALGSLRARYGTWGAWRTLEAEDRSFRQSIEDGRFEEEWRALNRRLMEEAARLAREHRIGLLFVHLAAHGETSRNANPGDARSPAEELMRDTSAALGAPFLATSEAFRNAPNTWTDGHYKAPECAFVARLIYDALQQLPAWQEGLAR